MGKLALLHGVWTELVACGARFMGTPGAEQAVEVITRYLQRWGLQYHCHEYEYTSWLPGDPPRLAWDGREREAYVMLGSPGAQAKGPLSGTIEYVGPLGIWGRHDWERFALVSPQAELLAYIAGRQAGPAIPQTLPLGCDQVLYLGIGSADVQELLLAHQTGRVVTATLEANPSFGAVQIGRSVVAELPRRGDRLVIIGAHYDSFWNTAGAYDNASGAACLLSLAHQLRDGMPGLNVRLVWFGSEEWLLAGSNAYVQMLEERGEVPSFMLNLDGVGRGDVLEVWYGPDPLLPFLRETIEPQAAELGVATRYIFPPPEGSDHAAFYRAGSKVCMLTFNDLEILHRAEDSIDEAKLRNMQKTLQIAQALLDRLPHQEL